MSTDNNYSWEKATNDGRRQAEMNQPLAPQKHDEPSSLFQQRQNTYDWNKQK